MRTISVLALAAAMAVGTLSHTAAAADDKDIKLSGCLVRGENGGGYLLTNAPGESVWDRARDVSVEPGPAGTTGRAGSVFYWLDDNGDLKDHVGHQVEIDGKLKGEVNDGQIKVDRKANWSEMEVKSDGRTLKARVPASLFVYPAGKTDGDPKARVLVRKVDVRKVAMRAASCEQ
jgi:hypothetical protein